MPKKKAKEEKIAWAGSEAQATLLRDLREGTIPLSVGQLSAEEAWGAYRDRSGFEDVPFSQFKKKLGDHRKQVLQDDGRVAAACAD